MNNSLISTFVLFSVLALGVTASVCAVEKPDLVAHYTFDEDAGNFVEHHTGHVARDMSGKGNAGLVYGAQYAPNGSGSCLVLDGVDDYVDCGKAPSLNLTKEVTLETWVQPAGFPAEGKEPGILGKALSSFIMTYYGEGGCYLYINEGRNNLRMTMLPGMWHHVVATFDGAQMKLYQDGQLKYARSINVDKIAEGKNFYIGCMIGDSRTDQGPKHPRTAFFAGKIDDVKIYSRALTAAEVKAGYDEGVKGPDKLANYEPEPAIETVTQGDITVKASKNGQLLITAGPQSCIVESTFSYPGHKIGWNALSAKPQGSEANWSVQLKKVSPQSLQIEAHGKFYAIRRTLEIKDGTIDFSDKFTNLDNEPVGVEIWNVLTQPEVFKDTISPGQKGWGANPTFFVSGKSGNMGVFLKDNVSRQRYQTVLGVPANQARFRISDLAFDVGNSLTIRWSMHPLGTIEDYFSFMNQLRRNLKSNFTVEGSFRFLKLGAPRGDDFWMPWEEPKQLKSYLQGMRLAMVAVIPFMDYTPGPDGRVWPRDEYKNKMQKAIRALKAADPKLKVLAAIECDWVAIDRENIKNGHLLPTAKPGEPSNNFALTAAQTRIVEAGSPWRDSMKRNKNGNGTIELYGGDSTPQSALGVYPVVGNYQYEFLMDQINFLFDEVGFDGFYIDQFSMVNSTIKTYDKWDGFSAELDSKTGRIKRRYFDANVAGITARVNLCKVALDRGKVVVANTYATSAEEVSLPIYRFSETWNAFDPMATPDGEKPPLVPYLFRGSLASPVALGLSKGPSGANDTARRTIKGVVTYLRHGLLYYHYHIRQIPLEGPGSGENGPINHMFPLTPVGVHEGWVEGEERTITSVSGNYAWKHQAPPKIYLFDLDGKQIEHQIESVKTADGWRVPINLNDWAQIAVLE
jgi:hypothetical protein